MKRLTFGLDPRHYYTAISTVLIYLLTSINYGMITIKHLRLGAIVCMAIFIFSACRKNGAVNPTPIVSTGTNAVTLTDTVGKVLTPVGYVEKSKVHFIAEGFHLSVQNGHLQKLETKTGRMIEDFGEVRPMDQQLIAGVANRHRNANNILPETQGWIADAWWSNPNTGTPVTYFSTNWTVPSTPSNQSSQTIFLFNGLQDGTTSTSYIIQPVLQWGGSAAGGGQYWAVADWYVSSSQVFYTTPQAVSSGTNLQGLMQQVAVSGSSYNYLIKFNGYNALEIDGIPQATWAAETLESYGVTDPSTMYPPNTDVAMTNIVMMEGSTYPSISWTTGQAVSGSAQRAVVVSNSTSNGEVDIYFR